MDVNKTASNMSLDDEEPERFLDIFFRKIVTLIKAGANVNISLDEHQNTYLHEAVRLRNEKSVRILLVRGANPNIYAEQYDSVTNNYDAFTPLHCAVQQKLYKIVRILLKYHADTNLYTSSGFTALHLAVKSNCILTLQNVLFSSDVDAVVNNYDFKGCTALHLAIILKNIEAIELLLDYNADIAISNHAGFIPFQYINSSDVLNAVLKHPKFFKKEEELVQYLCEQKVDLNKKPISLSSSFLTFAIECGFDKFAQYVDKLSVFADNNIDSDLYFLRQTFQNQLKINSATDIVQDSVS